MNPDSEGDEILKCVSKSLGDKIVQTVVFRNSGMTYNRRLKLHFLDNILQKKVLIDEFYASVVNSSNIFTYFNHIVVYALDQPGY